MTTRQGLDARIDNVAPHIGIMMALYAAMQFIFAPVMGALSDRLDRRPVLLISLTGAEVTMRRRSGRARRSRIAYFGRAFDI